MSFLDTKTVVQTCILSSRWKCVWKRVPALILDYYSFGRWYSRFATFVDKVLSLRCPLKLNKIIYISGYREEEEAESKDDFGAIFDPLVTRVVEYAVSHGASHLRLDLSHHLYMIGSCRFSESCALIFECDLKTLSLGAFEINDRFGSFGFRALTELSLVECAFQSNQDLLDPFSKFPCLKNLVLYNSYMLYDENHTRFRISGLQLHNLEVSNIAVERIEISAPNLKSFKLCNIERSIKFSELDLPSLDCANIDCVVEANISVEDWDLLFQGCHNAKSLTLCALTMETSVLSRRWKCVWKHVPALNLDARSFGYCYSRFARFVDKVLSLRYPLNVNRIIYISGYTEAEAEAEAEECSLAGKDLLVVKVIKYAASHGTRHLNLEHCYVDEPNILSKSYASISECDLETLSLFSFEIDNRLQSFGFRMLTEMSLIKCDFRSDQELPDPFSKFPCLKSLVLDMFYWDFENHRRFRIFGPQLHNLKLSFMSVSGVEISAPKLKSLAVNNLYGSLDFSEINLPSLEHVDIQFDDFDVDEVFTVKEDWDIMFRGCHNVKSLTLGTSGLEILCKFSGFLEQQPSPFTRLEYLNLTKNPCPKSIPFKMPWDDKPYCSSF
ncbi:F-box/FBD/LRR-repeat protein At5g56420 [Linum perenne]